MVVGWGGGEWGGKRPTSTDAVLFPTPLCSVLAATVATAALSLYPAHWSMAQALAARVRAPAGQCLRPAAAPHEGGRTELRTMELSSAPLSFPERASLLAAALPLPLLPPPRSGGATP